MNLFLGILELFVCFTGVLVMDKFFGKWGLYTWMALAVVFANIQVSKQVDIGGISTALGNVMFASTYLTTDILNEKYGDKASIAQNANAILAINGDYYGARESGYVIRNGTLYRNKASRNAVKIAAGALVAYIVFAMFTQAFLPNSYDVVSPGMKLIFAMSLRITTASGLMFLLSNWCDVILYKRLKEKMNGKHMWFRNNVSTIVCNCAENFAFSILAFIGTYPLVYCLEIAAAGSILEMLIAVCDTPFLYFSKKFIRNTGILLEKENEEGAQTDAEVAL